MLEKVLFQCFLILMYLFLFLQACKWRKSSKWFVDDEIFVWFKPFINSLFFDSKTRKNKDTDEDSLHGCHDHDRLPLTIVWWRQYNLITFFFIIINEKTVNLWGAMKIVYMHIYGMKIDNMSHLQINLTFREFNWDLLSNSDYCDSYVSHLIWVVVRELKITCFRQNSFLFHSARRLNW